MMGYYKCIFFPLCLVNFSLANLPSAICEGSTNIQVCLIPDGEIVEIIDIIVSVDDITTERKLLCRLNPH